MLYVVLILDIKSGFSLKHNKKLLTSDEEQEGESQAAPRLHDGDKPVIGETFYILEANIPMYKVQLLSCTMHYHIGNMGSKPFWKGTWIFAVND